MTNQQEIEFYLSKGFVCEVRFEDDDIIKLFYSDTINYIGYRIVKNGKNICDKWNNEDIQYWEGIKSITPIPPKPYEFKVGDRVIVILSNEIRIVKIVNDNCTYRLNDGKCWFGYDLAPALPEDEECVEEIELDDEDIRTLTLNCKNYITVKMKDGKKLKIKVIKK